MTALTQNGREILSKKNVSETLQYLTLGDGTGRLLGVQVFGNSGTYVKSPGVKKIIIEAVGGGGASGNLSATASNNCGISAAGSPGAYGKAFYYQNIPASVSVTVGGGGVGGAGPGGSGGDGGQTSFGSLLVCPGGKGSQQRQQVPPFSGGSADEASPPTGAGLLFHSVSRSPSCAAFGLGDDMAVGLESTVSTMIGVYGKGGTGKYSPANSAASRGNDGSQGYIIVWEYQ
ncbi:glycine-rich domain-containing protein [Escherichia coli]|uniref:glycine-rich domain-containing protein n=1 Tax=Escherichia coli TaxID=562 RepID=UPI003F938D50